MKFRKSDRKGWRKAALTLPPLLIALFAIAVCHTTANSGWAQTSKPQPSKPGAVPAGQPAQTANPVDVQRLVSLRTQFTEEFNQVLQNPEGAAKKGNWILHTKIGPGFVSESLIKWDNPATARIASLTHVQLEELRDVVARQIDEAIQMERAGKHGAQFVQGSFRGHVFTGKMQPVNGPVSLPEINSQTAAK